ncbi:MAG: acyl-CoA thioesterase [Bacteroidetes bacterium]|nr:acyl-CoA thioesterase [Bacteroidota bacterium]
MYTSEVKVRVRYSETDRMGYVYYGNYASYFEVARVEALRDIGMPYLRMEDEGYLLPVLDYKVRYLKPAYYDDLLIIKTSISQLPSVKIIFSYEVFGEDGQKLNVAETTLVFINKVSGKPCKAPQELLEKLKPFFP